MKRALAALALVAALFLAAGGAGSARGEKDTPYALTLFVGRYFSAWNGHDPSALARVFNADGEATDSTGRSVRGRDAIEAAARAAFADAFKDAEIHFVRIDTREVAPGVEAIDVRWWIFGATAPHWERKQYGLSSWVAQRSHGEWQILTAHEQLVANPETPPPATPSPSPAPPQERGRHTNRTHAI